MTSKGAAFEPSPDNLAGRQQIMKGVMMHNKLIVSSAPYVECHQDKKLIACKELRSQRPNWLPTPYEASMAAMQSDIMHQLIDKSRSCVDTTPPGLAWGYHKMQNHHRRKMLSDPEYWKTKGHEIQWSNTEKQEANTAFHAMHKAQSCSQTRIDNKLKDTTVKYLEWQRQEHSKKLPPINVPLKSAGRDSPVQTKAKKRTQPNRSKSTPPLQNGTDATWELPGSSATRELCCGVPDYCADSLKVAAVSSNPKQPTSKGLPKELVQRTIKNGWSCATNSLVRSRFLARQTGTDPSEGAAASPVQLIQQINAEAPQSPMQRPLSQQLMYRAQARESWLASNSNELTVQKGDLVFCIGNAAEGWLRVVDVDGKMGELPCTAVKFLEPCDHLQHE